MTRANAFTHNSSPGTRRDPPGGRRLAFLRGFKLRTKFLLSLLLLSTSLTCVTLLIVRHRVRVQVRNEFFNGLRNSVETFQSLQRQREDTLSRSAALLADLPRLKALMTTQHEPTIQDAAADLWHLVGSDLFVLGDRSGRLVALHTKEAGVTRHDAQQFLGRFMQTGEPRDWWFSGGHLFEVFIQPIYFGAASDNSPLGVLAVGYEIDEHVADDISRVASSRVAFYYGKSVVISTLSPAQQLELAAQRQAASEPGRSGLVDVELGGERFLFTTVELSPGSKPTVKLSLLKSYDQATAFLYSLNKWILGVGLAAVLAGSALVFLISTTFMRPLANLISGVHALEKGDYIYPLKMQGTDEISELTGAFDRMRLTLRKTQQQSLQTERLATIGRMASTISHDLRHPLTAILAYAEFLSEDKLESEERRDLYREIRGAVNRMTDQINSLLGFSKGREDLHLTYCSVEEIVQAAVHTIRTRPEFRAVGIAFSEEGDCNGYWDSGKLERVFHNLLLNACEAVDAESGCINIHARRSEDSVEIVVSDNGSGIPESVRDRMFEPFVSHGKVNGTGLGLSMVQKTVQEHGGQISVETAAPTGTAFRFTLPVNCSPDKAASRSR
jgi:signal transduction histidine kinase